VLPQSFPLAVQKIQTNHFPISFDFEKSHVYSYTIKILPEIPDDSRQLRQLIIHNVADQIRKELNGDFYSSGNTIFGSFKCEKQITFQSIVNKKKYALALNYHKHIDLQILKSESNIVNKLPAIKFINIFIKSLMQDMKYIEIGKNAQFFMQKENFIDKVRGTPLKVWRGFKTSVDMYENNQVKLLVDFSCKIMRKDTMHDFIYELKQRRKNKAMI